MQGSSMRRSASVAPVGSPLLESGSGGIDVGIGPVASAVGSPLVFDVDVDVGVPVPLLALALEPVALLDPEGGADGSFDEDADPVVGPLVCRSAPPLPPPPDVSNAHAASPRRAAAPT